MGSANLTQWAGMPSEEFWHAVSRGVYPRISSEHKFGQALTIGVDYETIWDANNGGRYNFATEAEPLMIASGGDPADSPAGSGATGVICYGLNASGYAVAASLATNGSGASGSTAVSFFRNFRTIVKEVGTYDNTNVGSITIVGANTGTVYSRIAAGNGQTQMLVYTIPRGYTGFLSRFAVEADVNKFLEARLKIREDAFNVSSGIKPTRSVLSVAAIKNPYEISAKTLYFRVPELTDVWADARVDTGTGDVTAQLDFTLVRNT